jgi:hypothetical protein
VQPLPVAQRVAHLHQRPRDPLQRRADEPHRPRKRVTHDAPQSAVLRRVQADADRLATPPRPPCFQVAVASHSPPLLLARREPLTQPVLLLLDVPKLLVQHADAQFDFGYVLFYLIEPGIQSRRPHFLLSDAPVEVIHALPVPVPVVRGEATTWSPETVQVGT